MAHVCPHCNEACECHGDTSRVVRLQMPDDCEHCEVEDEVLDDAPEVDEMDARPGRRW